MGMYVINWCIVLHFITSDFILKEVTACDVIRNFRITNVTCAFRSTVTLNCTTPPGTIEWFGPPSFSSYAYKQEINWPAVPNDLRTRLNILSEEGIYNLQIKNLQPSDAGRYKCQLRQAYAEFELNIIGNITARVSQSHYVGNIGEKITLGCIVRSPSSPVRQVYWYKSNGIKIEPSKDKYTGSTPTNPSLTINNLVLSDSGPYYCSTTNEIGLNARSDQTTLSLVEKRKRTGNGPNVPVILVSVCFLLVILVIVVILRKKKPMFLRQLAYKLQNYEDDDSKTWDAFVSFKSEEADTQFVVSKLYPKLEKELGFKLCIHQKDFLPGKAITNNIVDAIINSRRTILIISKEYLHGGYTTFEYEVAHSEMIKSKHQIIPILLEDIKNLEGSMDDTLKYIIQSVTYITFPGESNQKALRTFWKRLELAMPKKAKKVLSQGRESSLLIE